ncbi:MAG: DUF362 domain-containing protein [Gemmatimonadota bacterium]
MRSRPLVFTERVAGYSPGEIRRVVRSLSAGLGWSPAGAAAFAVPGRGARVVVKPNWVLHENRGPWGIEPLVTHSSVVRAVVEEALLAGAAAVSLGDAPLQECDFDGLMLAGGLDEWGAALSARESRFRGPLDYRRTRSAVVNGVRSEREDQVPLDRFVFFDLGGDSLLEPITTPGRFRVTQYPHELLARTHAPGRHQYLIARDIIEADLVINLPKLKTHKKAGVTCALKNLIGINGNKEFLPHHRLGGSEGGGDCYPGTDAVKRTLEFAFDRLNSTRSQRVRRGLHLGIRALNRVSSVRGDTLGIEGAWSGNDTIWRTCLDLNRILVYGRTDGTLTDQPQRRILHVVDAVVAGQGDGPLSAEPLPMGLMLASENAAAADLAGASLLGYDPFRIPIVAHAFDRFRWPLTDFAPEDVRVEGTLGQGRAVDLSPAPGTHVNYPEGWTDAVASMSERAGH